MIRIKYLFAIILINLGVSKISYAQHQNVTANTLQSRLDNIQSTMVINRENLKYVKGSPYINEEFEIVKIKTFGDKIFAGRYDANLGEMQIKRKNDTIALNNYENFEITFALNNKVYKTHNYTTEKGESKQGFLVVLKETDSLAILKEESVKYYKEQPATTSYDKAKPAEFRRLRDVYYYRIGKETSFLPQKRRHFLKLFPKHSNKLKAFIKENRINLKDENDLITLFTYIETLDSAN